MAIVQSLPIYPSTQTRKTLSPSQLSTFNRIVSNSLAETIALPPEKRDTAGNRAFVSSYARDAAQQCLESLIWGPQNSPQADTIKQRVLLLAEKLILASSGLDIQTLVDLAIVYAPSHRSRVRGLFATALAGSPSLPSSFQSEAVTAFTSLLNPTNSQGLYGLRRTARCLVCLFRSCPQELLAPFAHDKPFCLTLARAYDEGLSAIANSYGGTRFTTEDRELDDWERIWLETKVDLMDSFHMLITSMLKSLSAGSGATLAAESESTFGIMFSLLETAPRSSTISSDGGRTTPFLNRSIIADYQHSYDLARTLASTLHAVSRDNARLDLLGSTLRSFDVESSGSGSAKDPGVFKLLIKSSGIAPGVDNLGKSSGTARQGDNRGKAKASPPDDLVRDPDLDLKITQVLDIFPDYAPAYIKILLTHPDLPFRGDSERVTEALLEGTAPAEEDLRPVQEDYAKPAEQEESNGGWVYTKDRRNIFDDQEMDVSQIHKGKKGLDSTAIMQDKAFMDQMKADILRFSEMISDDEDDDGQAKLSDDDLDDFTGKVRIAGDGEDSDRDEDEDDQGEDSATPARVQPETILELAYIRDQKLFDRDAQTRRSKARADLRSQTGWADEQIEGWKIMLERNPKKDKILQKHEFAGNRSIPVAGPSGTSTPSGRGSGQGRGGGRGSGQGRGTGRGRGGGPNEGRDSTARDHAWKDKNKASRGNHNRKRGHDKKMARAGAGPSV